MQERGSGGRREMGGEQRWNVRVSDEDIFIYCFRRVNIMIFVNPGRAYRDTRLCIASCDGDFYAWGPWCCVFLIARLLYVHTTRPSASPLRSSFYNHQDFQNFSPKIPCITNLLGTIYPLLGILNPETVIIHYCSVAHLSKAVNSWRSVLAHPC